MKMAVLIFAGLILGGLGAYIFVRFFLPGGEAQTKSQSTLCIAVFIGIAVGFWLIVFR